MENPLEKLLVSHVELDRELVATILADLVRIDKDTGEIRFTMDGAKLSNKLRILTYLLARKAAKALNLVPEEPISSSELTSQLGISGGSLRGQLSLLNGERLIDKREGKYFVPNYSVEQVKTLIDQAAGKGK